MDQLWAFLVKHYFSHTTRAPWKGMNRSKIWGVRFIHTQQRRLECLVNEQTDESKQGGWRKRRGLSSIASSWLHNAAFCLSGRGGGRCEAGGVSWGWSTGKRKVRNGANGGKNGETEEKKSQPFWVERNPMIKSPPFHRCNDRELRKWKCYWVLTISPLHVHVLCVPLILSTFLCSLASSVL